MKKFRYQSVLLTIASGYTANNLAEQQMNLDPAYNTITGIQFNVVDSSTLANNLLLGARSENKVEVDLVPVAAVNGNAAGQAGVAPDDKFVSVMIGYGSGDKFYAQSKPLTSPGADVQIYMTLRLEVSNSEIPRV